MAKEKADEVNVDIQVDDNVEQPPEGYTAEEWRDLSPTEKEGILDGITAPEGEEAPKEELNDDDKNTLEGIAGDEKSLEEKEKEEAAAAEQARLEGLAKEQGKTVEEIIAAEAAQNTAQDEVTDDALLNFQPVLTKEEMPVFEELPEEIPAAITEKLHALDEKFDLGDITQREFNAERDKLNREIIKHNTKINDEARAAFEAQKDELIWKKEQIYFLNAKPEYMASRVTDAAEKVKCNALFGALTEMVKAISNDPKNASLTGIQILVKADKAVKEAFGIKPAEKKEVKKVETKPAAKIPDHKTLADIPNAAGNNEGVDDSFAQIDKLSGEAYEQALERMSPAVKEAYLARV
ncbi:MAG: hypothetical protein CVU62_13205 [Deltaproteobacteria bacterium HGW-Deltaproteobacteria-2]|jgi:hypothetical protein|nr:MAG: hypothetical protein CVU62_13205 [Deltaproteobacteria bacterium HGW-Deltaproteobacteria-2]